MPYRWTVNVCVPIRSKPSLVGGMWSETFRGVYVSVTFLWAHDEIRELVPIRPRVIYIVPIGQNPSGLVCRNMQFFLPVII